MKIVSHLFFDLQSDSLMMIVIKKLPLHIITLATALIQPLTCMDHTSLEKTSASFPKATLQYFHTQRCSNLHEHPSIKVLSADNSFSYLLCATKAMVSKYFKKTYGMPTTKKEEYTYYFDAKISPTAAFLITAYLQCASTEHQSVIERTITTNPAETQKFDLFSEVMCTAQSLRIKPLITYLHNFLFTTFENYRLLDTLESPDQLSFYKELFSYHNPYNETHFTLQEQATVKQLIVSSDKKYIVTAILSPRTKRLNVMIYHGIMPFQPLTLLNLDIQENPESAMLEFSPDSSLLAIKTDQKLTFYACKDFEKTPNNLKAIASLKTEHNSHILAFSFTHNSKKIMVTTNDGFGTLYDCSTFDAVAHLDFAGQRVLDKPLFTPDDNHVIIALDHEYALYSCTDTKKIISRRTGEFPINALTLSPDGKELIVQAEPLCLFIQTEGLQFQANVKTDLFTLTKTAFSYDSLYSAVTSNNQCYLFKRGENTPVQSYTCKHDIIHVSFSPTQPYLMLFDKQACSLYNYETHELIKRVPSNCIGGAQAIFAPDGSFFVITCNKTGKIYLTYPLEEVFDAPKKSKTNLLEHKDE